ncbi:Protein of unknown function [Actinacidiphila yanglinensis]|uniref:DUF2797 domain-containing protein n=2 Tax=Actinacidiphila yanglinensis TaxID=310779 RepID=A0A1H6DXH1_9ACTN|nr:Protein of unknown function [Actinacidiphila yanglinensis]
MRWREEGARWMWAHPSRGVRASPVRLGAPLHLAVAGDAVRRCAGVWRRGRGIPCPDSTEVAPGARRDQCETCAALDRASSVAADTVPDDRQPYAVYLAYFGPGLLKVGITAVARGRLRLLEQAAVCFTFLGEGPLMAARRTESVLGSALDVPDRVLDPAKREARHRLPGPAARAAEVAALHARVTALHDKLPESLRRAPLRCVDHAEEFGLDTDPPPPPPAAEVTALPPGSAVTGTVRAIAGHDLHLDTAEGPLLLDARLAAGWPLSRPDGQTLPAPTAPLRPRTPDPDPLF